MDTWGTCELPWGLCGGSRDRQVVAFMPGVCKPQVPAAHTSPRAKELCSLQRPPLSIALCQDAAPGGPGRGPCGCAPSLCPSAAWGPTSPAWLREQTHSPEGGPIPRRPHSGGRWVFPAPT